MSKYRKKPVEVEAFQLTAATSVSHLPPWFLDAIHEGKIQLTPGNHAKAKIITLEGTMEVLDGDYVIRGVEGEIYPCKAPIFDKTYELAW